MNLNLFSDFSGKNDNLILSMTDYLLSAVPGMSKKLWEEAEKSALEKGLLEKGGYMDIKERIKEEGRLEGRLERNREVILKMFQKEADISFISEVTGLSEEEIRKLKNDS